MKKKYKKFLTIAVLAVVLSSIALILYIDFKNKKSTEGVSETHEQQTEEIKYLTPGSSEVTIKAMNNVLYIDNPTTSISCYALDNSGQLLHFRQSDRAFVRILGVTRLYTDNVEILHPKKPDGSEDDTIFLGNITIPLTGKYLIKVCLGKSINLDVNGTLIWPFGCYDSKTSDVIDVYENN